MATSDAPLLFVKLGGFHCTDIVRVADIRLLLAKYRQQPRS